MMIYLPYPNFVHSVEAIAPDELVGQVLNAYRLISALREQHVIGVLPKWIDHREAGLWHGHVGSLAFFITLVESECDKAGVGYSCVVPYNAKWRSAAGWYPELIPAEAEQIVMPKWLGNERYHSTIRSRLLSRNPEWYGQYGWTDVPKLISYYPHLED